MVNSYRFRLFIISLTILVISCKNNSDLSKQEEKLAFKNIDKSTEVTIQDNFTYKDLVGKTFYYLNEKDREGNEFVHDKGAGVDKLVFKEGKLNIYRPIEWQNYNVVQVIEKGDYLILNLKFEALDRLDKMKIEYDSKNGLLKESYLDSEYEMKYIDSLYLFNNNSAYKYKYSGSEFYDDKIKVNSYEYTKNKTGIISSKILSIKEWIGNNTIKDSVIGDLNSDNIEDRIYCLVPKDKTDNESKVETIVLLGTNQQNMYSLYVKSDNIVPCQYCEFENYRFLESFYLSRIENNKLTFGSSAEHVEFVREYLEFVFEYKDEKIVLTKISKEFETNDDKQNINLPEFEITLKEFNIYSFLKNSN